MIHHGDNLPILRGMADNSVDAVVTDPQYGLGFMGKRWDCDVPTIEVWTECLRVLKPGGQLLAFAATRTQHRMCCRIEDAGFEIRDMIAWVYGCLDEATEVATATGVIPYHKTKIGDLALCYDAQTGDYSYQPILEIVEYDYSDTAYRLVGDFGEQVVSRNHRVIVECDGIEAFQLAESLQREARVPVLEDLPALQRAVHDAHQGAGRPQQVVQSGVQCVAGVGAEGGRHGAVGAAQGTACVVRCLRQECMEAGCLAQEGGDADVQQAVQWGAARGGMGWARAQGASDLDARVGGQTGQADDRADESIVEGRPDVSEAQRGLCRPADQVRAVPGGADVDGPQGWLRDGASADRCAGRGACADEGRCGSPCQPQRDGQRAEEPDAVRDERRPQGIRAWGGHQTALVRVVPFHYVGKVWCLRVPTGAFVAVRNGVAFPTGNSGFPKSHNGDWGGTALKPALEPITMARKPLDGTVAANVAKYGTGGLNIDGCRVQSWTDDDLKHMAKCTRGTGGMYTPGTAIEPMPVAIGRWPANLIHDGSDEVLAAFPQALGQIARARTDGEPSGNAVLGALRNVTKNPTPRGDAGSAARFFYCAKASKAERNAGCEEVATWEGVDLNPVVESFSGLRKAMSESTTPLLGAFEWSMFWSGSDITDRCQKAIKSIIETASRTRSNTSASIRAAIAIATENGSSLAELAEATSPWTRATTGDAMGSVRHAAHAALRALFETSALGRTGNVHSTVKPVALMRYLCRLVTPTGGVVLDPFCGSGSTGVAARQEGFQFIGIELEADYVRIAEARIAAAEGPQARMFA